MYTLGDIGLQRTTWSNYYNLNCAKGGVFIQLCGWVGSELLWTGGFGNSDNQSRGMILRAHNVYSSAVWANMYNLSGLVN